MRWESDRHEPAAFTAYSNSNSSFSCCFHLGSHCTCPLNDQTRTHPVLWTPHRRCARRSFAPLRRSWWSACLGLRGGSFFYICTNTSGLLAISSFIIFLVLLITAGLCRKLLNEFAFEKIPASATQLHGDRARQLYWSLVLAHTQIYNCEQPREAAASS